MAQGFLGTVRAQLWTSVCEDLDTLKPWLKCHLLHSEPGKTRSSPRWPGKWLPSSHAPRRKQDCSGKMKTSLKAGTCLTFHQSPPCPGALYPLLWNVTSVRVGTYQATGPPGPSTVPGTQAAVSKYFSNEWKRGAQTHVPPILKWCFHCVKIEKKNYS